MPQRTRFLYFGLAVLFAISMGYRMREIRDRVELLLHSEVHARRPFNIDIPGNQIVGPEAAAASAGLRAGDTIVNIGNRPFRGAVDLFVPLKDARPGDRLNVQVRSKTGEVKTASIELKSRPISLSEAIQVCVADLMPVFCLALGFWVAAVRIQDPLAWIFLAMMLSFGETIGAGSFVSLFGHDDLLEPVFAGYQQLAGNTWSLYMMLFGIYFPERFEFDRRWPWVKWLVATPIVLRATQLATAVVMDGTHASAAIALERFWRSEMIVMIPQMVAISYFFAAIGDKTMRAKNPDKRRRLWLLYLGASISMTPAFIYILVKISLRRAIFESAGATVVLLWMLIGFPLTMAYVIVVERAMDVRVVIRQGLQYILASTSVRVMQIVLSATVLIIATLAGQNMSRPLRLYFVGFGLLAVNLIRRVAIRARTWVDRRFFREAYDAEQILGELANRVRTIVETGPLLETVVHRISESLHIPRVAVLLNGNSSFQLAYEVGYSPAPDVMIPVETPDLEKTAKTQLDAELVLPLVLNKKVLGLLSLGPKRSEEPYSKADMYLLGSVATQTGLALENSRLTAEIAAEVSQRERINREIEIAREVQERLFPQDLPEVAGFDYSGACRPASGVGGDYYDFLLLPGEKLGIAIGDVSGKGIPAALLMAGLRASLRGQTIQGAPSLAHLMNNLNKLVYESSSSNRYATFFFANYDPSTRGLTYVNCGHNPPLVFRTSGAIERLETGGPVVGLLPMSFYQQAEVTMHPGDLFVAFTDGVSEAMNADQQEWGEDRLIECVRHYSGLSAQQTIRRIMEAADAFAAGAKQHDDMTVVVAVLK
jgi:sigma-B regulation protein RsbU (phosphoserine phosphatase)